jgi:hypothetical protein
VYIAVAPEVHVAETEKAQPWISNAEASSPATLENAV